MRSRYSAYALGLTKYLQATWHTSTRPADLTLTDNPQWLKLDVLTATMEGNHGTVHFKAHFQEGNTTHCLEENSRFVREHGRWYYLDGQIQ